MRFKPSFEFKYPYYESNGHSSVIHKIF